MNILNRLEVIKKISALKENWVHDDLFRLLNSEDIWTLAYQNTKENKAVLTPGVAKTAYDGISLERIRNIQSQVISEQYRFQHIRSPYIPKPNDHLRALKINTLNDKLVQEVIRIILEAVYEPIFVQNSYGFRPGRNTHQALASVEKSFRWMNWVIEGDVEQPYTSIDHNILCGFIEKRIRDTRFLRLIRKTLKSGVLDDSNLSYSNIGVTKGSIVFPILANIYFHEFDIWIKEKANSLNRPASKLASLEYKKLEHRIAYIGKKLTELPKGSILYKLNLKELLLKRAKRYDVSSQKDSGVKIEYVRYADDWLIGVKGDFKLATQLKDAVGRFFQHTLKQKLHPEKTKITNLRKGKVRFLGYEIYLLQKLKISKFMNRGIGIMRRTNAELRLSIPLVSIITRMIERGYVIRNEKGIRPISKSEYSSLEDQVIVSHFRSVWLGLSNYYSGSTDLNSLQYIHYLLKFSCAMTLGHRHRMNLSQVFVKYQKVLTVKVNNSKIVCFPNRKKWSVYDRFWQMTSKSNAKKNPFKIMTNKTSCSSLRSVCLLRNTSEGIEINHVKHV